MQKRALLINDISGVGKCSLTVALPIISAFGFEASVMPTAVLSTHTGGFENYTFCDLTDNMLPMARHWHSLDLHFDVIYAGYLGSKQQIEIVGQILDLLCAEDTTFILDPVMGDFGRLYKHFSPDFPKKLGALLERADVIAPNFTEACLLTDTEYTEDHGEKSAAVIIEKLYEMYNAGVVLTGVCGGENLLGAACAESTDKKPHYCFAPHIDGVYHGSGDVFCSVMCGELMNGKPLRSAVKSAVDFTSAAIKRTHEEGIDTRFGLVFEPEIKNLISGLVE